MGAEMPVWIEEVLLIIIFWGLYWLQLNRLVQEVAHPGADFLDRVARQYHYAFICALMAIVAALGIPRTIIEALLKVTGITLN